jgi:23S rRNA pseudouridine1911/1915/1917 synthase
LDEGPLPDRLTFIYEDEHLLVVDKPPLMTVHPTARHHKHTVIKLLEAQRPGEDLALIHRLDRETSGILLVAKSKEADRRFKAGLERLSLLEAGRAERGEPVEGPPTKSYIAITWGTPQDGLINAPLEADPSPLRVKMSVCASGGLAARTGVKVLKSAGAYALVQCDLYTGRQHQIRVHLAEGGTPIVGDKLYGPDEMLLARGADNQLTEDDLQILELPRHALHAAEYRLKHPFTKEVILLRSELPDDLSSFFESKLKSSGPDSPPLR